jgi:hypothetical protein
LFLLLVTYETAVAALAHYSLGYTANRGTSF